MNLRKKYKQLFEGKIRSNDAILLTEAAGLSTNDPKYISKDRFNIILQLISACKQMAIETGCLDVWAVTNSKGIIKRCKKLKYNITENNYALISI